MKLSGDHVGRQFRPERIANVLAIFYSRNKGENFLRTLRRPRQSNGFNASQVAQVGFNLSKLNAIAAYFDLVIAAPVIDIVSLGIQLNNVAGSVITRGTSMAISMRNRLCCS